MKNRISPKERLAQLRSEAEAREQKLDAGTSRLPSAQDALVHDLQVHQLELEMQNEQLFTTQELLHESLEKYADLYNFAPVGYITLDRDGLILETNPTFSSQIDLNRADLINTPLGGYLAGEDRGRLHAHLDEVFATEGRQTCELRLEKPKGSILYIQLTSIAVKKDDGSQLCRTSVTDISIRRGVEKKLVKMRDELERRVEERTAELFVGEKKFRRLSQEFHALLNAITDFLILFSPEMNVLWTNNEENIQFRAKDSDPAGQFCYTLIYDRAALSLDCPISRCFASGQREVAVANYQGAVLDLRAFPILEGHKVSRVLLLISDITEKMALQAEAMQAGHMASLGELASGVAHEINNPITGIINYGQILVNECLAGSMEKEIGERIVKEGDRVGRIVKTLLSYARDGRNEKTPTAVRAILEESIILTQAQIRKEGIDLQIDLAEDLPEINANLQQVQQCFINIINNARYALNEKYPERDSQKRLEITGRNCAVDDRPYLRMVFCDHGIGIPADEMSMLTRQFFSTKPFGKGTGLGLSITEKIIKDHGGQLFFESTAGEFTRVIIDFPVAPKITKGES
ncbi:MAG: PAS domain-containing protein [Deltaproteobacteria bacterium]|nr:MAG: PAS domain-containing protein [Deltaproteobacteria bacterium]